MKRQMPMILAAAAFGVSAVVFGVAAGMAQDGAGAKAEAALSGGAGTEAGTATAVFAGGCFWCVEADFDKLDGVVRTTSGYSGGHTDNPTYEEVTYGDTGHYEVVEIAYDPEKVTYRELVDHFWRTVDPTDAGGQFCDRGDSYRTAVFVDGSAERESAEASRAEADALLEAPIVTPILDAAPFTPAEDYHQDYYLKNPLRYKYYRWSCGRDQRIEDLWAQANEPAG